MVSPDSGALLQRPGHRRGGVNVDLMSTGWPCMHDSLMAQRIPPGLPRPRPRGQEGCHSCEQCAINRSLPQMPQASTLTGSTRGEPRAQVPRKAPPGKERAEKPHTWYWTWFFLLSRVGGRLPGQCRQGLPLTQQAGRLRIDAAILRFTICPSPDWPSKRPSCMITLPRNSVMVGQPLISQPAKGV